MHAGFPKMLSKVQPLSRQSISLIIETRNHDTTIVASCRIASISLIPTPSSSMTRSLRTCLLLSSCTIRSLGVELASPLRISLCSFSLTLLLHLTPLLAGAALLVEQVRRPVDIARLHVRLAEALGFVVDAAALGCFGAVVGGLLVAVVVVVGWHCWVLEVG